MSPRSMEDAYTSQCIPILIEYFLILMWFSFSTQDILLAMIEKIKTSRDNKQFCAAILTDLSKVFDCICYDLRKGTVSEHL